MRFRSSTSPSLVSQAVDDCPRVGLCPVRPQTSVVRKHRREVVMLAPLARADFAATKPTPGLEPGTPSLRVQPQAGGCNPLLQLRIRGAVGSASREAG
jgi:hypothetical protein